MKGKGKEGREWWKENKERKEGGIKGGKEEGKKEVKREGGRRGERKDKLRMLSKKIIFK
jgi:hypothetical protein